MRGRRGRGWGRGDSDDTASLVGRRVVIEGHGDDELNSNEGVVSEGGDSYGVRLDDETAVREVKKKIISFVELVEESDAAVGALEPFLFPAAAAGKLADAGSSSSSSSSFSASPSSSFSSSSSAAAAAAAPKKSPMYNHVNEDGKTERRSKANSMQKGRQKFLVICFSTERLKRVQVAARQLENKESFPANQAAPSSPSSSSSSSSSSLLIPMISK